MEKILRIEKDVTFKIGESCWGGYDGFEVVTDDQTIRVGITNEQSCCENWGYFMTNDDPSEFIGANLISVDIVDTCLVKVQHSAGHTVVALSERTVHQVHRH